MIAEALAGRRVAVTGATGFLGTALVERLLRSVPECEVLPLVRPGRRAGAAERVRRDILRNDAFDRLRREWGDRFEAEIARRVRPLGGDVSVDGLGLDDADRAALAEVDVVIHSAAAVSFDSPLDAAVAVNLLGPSRVAQALAAVGSRAHLVAVSTAYVAGNRRGEAPEALLTDTLFSTEVDWRAEVAGAQRARADADAESRRPERLKKFSKAARAELGAAGTPLLATRAERLREQWIDGRLVELGRARAAALGWPDAYAYTKALGERALAENRGDVPVSIVRPSIIESAMAEPYPGWIRGFRMAEPVIISYARGLLKDFPGLPEGVVDVIPVDFVVAATLAVAAGPAPEQPVVYQAVTGSRNPLKYRTLVDLVQDWFSARPLYDDAGQPIVVPDWSFPGRGRVRRQLDRAVKGLSAAEKVVAHLPVRGAKADVAARLEERRTQAERALGYVELYGAYVETEARFDDRRLAALWDTLPADDQADFCFDPRTIDWAAYVHDVHLPSIVHHARVRTKPGAKGGLSRSDRGRRAVLAPERTLAVFDLENTLVASNVVESYSWLASRRMDTGQRVRFVARMLSEAPSLLALDRRDRGDFLRHFYRRYDGAPADRLRADAWELFSDLLLEKSFPEGLRRVREHRRLGHRTVLLTGALDFVIEPLRPLFDDVVSASLDERDGRLTGELLAVPPTGEARALLLAQYASVNDLALTDAVAYADSASDLPMLESVGFPVAVNPEPKLATIARRRGWLVEHWSKAPGGPRPLLPMGARP
ncbi:MAG: alcohol-forming fatty acyl-CoA reductase [Actinomycetota bacterium]|nr:alcohol-forming fatty acyl-CoA reductase [Actinomycetota bacterium]